MTAITKDMVSVPALWRLSMEVHVDCVDIVLDSKVEDHALIYRRLPLGESARSTSALPGQSALTTVFEELIYENPALLSDFAHVDILIDTPRFTIVPAEVDDEATWLTIMRNLWPDLESVVLANALADSGETLLMLVDAGMVGFLKRTFLEARIWHPIAALAAYTNGINVECPDGRIFAVLQQQRLHLIGWRKQQLMLANAFDVRSTADAVYYILSASRHAGLSVASDQFMVWGEKEVREEVIAGLQKFASYVSPMILPPEVFRSGKEALEAPFELTILPLCE